MLSFGKSADYYSEKLTILGLFLKIREKKVKATFLIFFSTYLLQWGKISVLLETSINQEVFPDL